MIHELRIYRCMPGRLPDLNKRFESVTLKLWDKHGFQPVGFWTTVIGASNQDLTYLLEWKDLAERERLWAGFMADADWLKARARPPAASICATRGASLPAVRRVTQAV